MCSASLNRAVERNNMWLISALHKVKRVIYYTKGYKEHTNPSPQGGGGYPHKEVIKLLYYKNHIDHSLPPCFQTNSKIFIFFRFSGSLFFAIDSIVCGVSSTDSAETCQSWLVWNVSFNCSGIIVMALIAIKFNYSFTITANVCLKLQNQTLHFVAKRQFRRCMKSW